MSPTRPGFVIFGRCGASMFSGKRYGKLFGVSFTHEYRDFVIHCLKDVITNAENGGRGKLWEFHFACRAYQPSWGLPVTFCEIHDYTEDFDSPQEYRHLKRLYEWAVSPSLILRTLVVTWSVAFCLPCACWHRWKQWRRDHMSWRRASRQPWLIQDRIGPPRRAA